MGRTGNPVARIWHWAKGFFSPHERRSQSTSIAPRPISPRSTSTTGPRRHPVEPSIAPRADASSPVGDEWSRASTAPTSSRRCPTPQRGACRSRSRSGAPRYRRAFTLEDAERIAAEAADAGRPPARCDGPATPPPRSPPRSCGRGCEPCRRSTDWSWVSTPSAVQLRPRASCSRARAPNRSTRGSASAGGGVADHTERDGHDLLRARGGRPHRHGAARPSSGGEPLVLPLAVVQPDA